MFVLFLNLSILFLISFNHFHNLSFFSFNLNQIYFNLNQNLSIFISIVPYIFLKSFSYFSLTTQIFIIFLIYSISQNILKFFQTIFSFPNELIKILMPPYLLFLSYNIFKQPFFFLIDTLYFYPNNTKIL